MAVVVATNESLTSLYGTRIRYVGLRATISALENYFQFPVFGVLIADLWDGYNMVYKVLASI